ncbi:hypothetical protein JOF39_002402 [Glutamicibacter protophormiae]|uniref:GNAT family N-acetyltransferase n=1 Tax=Glutamicibacter protophormiae TaxID=37930 RepID=A0ABS4XS38_GLUPR|nr:hypothetical protein [Glutamicibacter protophormiae]
MPYIRHKTNLVYVLNSSVTLECHALEGYEISQLDNASVRFFFAREDIDQWRLKSYLRSLDKGCYGFVAHQDSAWAATHWIAPPGSGFPTHLPANISRDKFWCFNEHTRVEHRRRGLWSALKNVGISYVRDQFSDEVSVFSDTDLSNVASRRAHETFGFKPMGLVHTQSFRIPKVSTITHGKWDRAAKHPVTNKGTNGNAS